MEIIFILIHVANIILILALLGVYLQNYSRMKSKYTMGLSVFAAFFLAQSLMNLYFDATMPMYLSSSAETVATMLEGVKAVAFAVLLWISWE